MVKVALVISVVYMGSLSKSPDITIPAYYKNLEECHQQLDSLKEDLVDASDIFDSNNNRVLRIENREYHHRSYIFWTCSVTNLK